MIRVVRITTWPLPPRRPVGRYCAKEEFAFISMEWFGVGDSEGKFEHGTISR